MARALEGRVAMVTGGLGMAVHLNVRSEERAQGAVRREPDETVIPEVMAIPMRETSWP